ncbi:hypothetical protein WA026_012163 [Henosepilachna vigintioctopunctata]|uniref:Minichromosome loss protein Mcl1 middle region domain-containing protein n=1 Tax=Henosepilachna vigintioctopunctata TaxID=420089 RepID=A0AAW1VB23_9CUCU
MPISQVPLRYAHNEGHTDVCFSEDGQKYISCGSDGDMRIWSQDLYEDPVHNCVGEWALAVRQIANKLYIATSSNDVQIISFPDGNRDGLLDRYVAPINNIAVSKTGDLIALAAEEMEVKLIELSGDEKKSSSLTGFSGPCLSVAVCPKSKFIAASGGDGKLRIWNVSDRTLVKEISCFPKVNSFENAKNLCRIDFNPVDGSQLAYPDASSVVILNSSDWSEAITLNTADITEPYSIVQYSPCGKYLAASSLKGDFVIWDISKGIVNNSTKHPNNAQVCAFMWNPVDSNQIVYTDIEGQLGLLTECIDKQEAAVETEPMDNNSEVDFGDIQFEDDDEDNENAVSLDKLKKQYEDDIVPELQSIMSKSPSPRPRTPVIPLQEPFMPSSTPVHLDPRYLCWNEIGVIRCYGTVSEDDDSSSKSIEVDFHDSTFHNSMMMQNYQNYMMGSLSSAALAVANVSQVNVIPLASRTKEWTLNVDDNEEIVAIAASDQLICIGLSNSIIRVCAVYGTQRAIFSIPGPIVAMSTYKEDIMVAYHSGAIRNGDQCISFKLIRLEGMNIQGLDLGMTLGPQSTLAWLGFSDCGTPSVMDSLGMLHMYLLNSNTWIPFCNTLKHRKGLFDGFFVTAVFEANQTLCGIKCRGTMYPTVIPRPTMCEIPLEAPFAEMSTDKSQMESSLFTWSTLSIANTDKKFKEIALKTFALSCKTNLDQRALEVMEILANSQVLSLGIKYASRLDKKRLVEKLTELASQLSAEGEENDISNAVRNTEEVRPANRRTIVKKSNKKDEISIPEESENGDNLETSSYSVNDSINSSMNKTINTQESLFGSEPPKNPFLKSLKKNQPVNQNPLSLLDSSAGLNFEVNKSVKKDEVAEKRKQPETETDQQKNKQRKLDRFMFGKRS